MGGGGSQNSTTTQKFEPPSWTQQGWQDATARQEQLSSEPFQQYGLPTVAPLNDLQNSGLQMAVDQGMNGTPYGNQARQTGLATMQGGFLGQGPQANVQAGTNQYMGQGVSPGHNPYAGSNSYLDQMIGRNADNMAKSAQQGIMAQTDAMAARGGAFGGSAWQQLQSQNDAGLAKSIGDMATQNRFQDYTAQQGLAENAVNRDLSAQQFNLGFNGNLAQQGIQNNLGAQQYNTSQNMGAYGQERDRMQNAMGQAPAFSADDWRGTQAVTGAGDAYGAYTQKLLDSGKSQFDQQVNYPQQQLQNYLNVLSQASGTNGGQTSSTSQPGMSPLAGLLGLGAGAYGVSQFFK